MVESGAKEVTEEDMLGALMFGHEAIKELVAFQEKVVAEVGKEKMDIQLLQVSEDLEAEIMTAYKDAMVAKLFKQKKN